MAITINGSGTITGISAGGLPDDSIEAADIKDGAVTSAKIADGEVTSAKIADGEVTPAKLSGSIGNGTAAQVLQSSGDGAFSWADAEGGYVLDSVFEASASGNYTVPNNAEILDIYIGGGAGCSGHFNNDSNNGFGNGGGGSGGAFMRVNANEIGGVGTTIAYTIGAGGTNNSNSNTSVGNGNAGGTSTFGNYMTANGGGGGTGGNNGNTNNARANGGTATVNISGNYYAEADNGQLGAAFTARSNDPDEGCTGGDIYGGKGGRCRGMTNGTTYTIYSTTANTSDPYSEFFQAGERIGRTGENYTSYSATAAEGKLRVVVYKTV